MVTGGSVLALAFLVAVIAVRARVAALLTAPALEARRAVAGPGDGVAQGPVLALAAAAAVGSPVVAVACWMGRGRKVCLERGFRAIFMVTALEVLQDSCATTRKKLWNGNNYSSLLLRDRGSDLCDSCNGFFRSRASIIKHEAEI